MKILGVDLGKITLHKPRTPRQYFTDLTLGEALFPIVILFGLNAVDELDRAAFGVLVPDIRDAFHLTDQGILTLIALTLLGGLLLEIPLAYYSDRLPRARIAVLGAAVWAVFGIVTGLSVTVWMLWIARSGSGMGRAVVTPTHNGLIADYYPIEKRADVYGFHRIGTAVGSFFGAFAGGLLAFWFGWRTPFFVFVLPTVVFVVLGLRLKEPLRGHWERKAAGASEEAIATDEVPPSFAESVRILWQVRTLRRIWYSLPFLASSIIGLVTLTALYYDQVFHLDERARGFIGAATEPAAVIGLSLGIPLASRLMLKDPGLGLRLLAVVGVLVAGAFMLFALTPYLWLAIAMNILISGIVSLLAPGIFASLSLCIPPKVRSLGYSMSSLFVIPGVLALELVGYIADHFGIRQGLLLMVPIFLIGAWTLASASLYVKSDINRVWTSTAAQAEVAYLRGQGLAKLLLVRNLDVGYDGVQVLFHVDFEIDEGEIVALLGTNGAGKSTLLKAISGVIEATNGAIVFDGRDMTYAPPNEVAARGVVQVPGGAGVFPSLTVAENLRLAGWLHRRDRERTHDGVERVLSLFPVLRERLDQPAGNLSGGQQQMLTLGMAFVTRPRLLMIDELSLGLAPAVVEQLLPIVHEIRAQGTTIILVEQSVNLALTLAETAYFMEKGEIRFHGPTAELLSRPDVLRSVFLEGAATVDTATPSSAAVPSATNGNGVVTAPVVAVNGTNGDHPAAGEAAPARLALRGVSKTFGGLNALSDVALDVGPGELLGFLGPNGAGKTTLFNLLSGIYRRSCSTTVRAPARATSPASTRRPVPASASADRSRTAGCSRRSRWRKRWRSRSNGASRYAIRSRPRCTCRRSPTPSSTSTSASNSCSSCSASPTSATSSRVSSRPVAGASSISRACSRTSRPCSSSTNRRRASRSGRRRHSGRCCCASATRRVPASS